MTVDKITIEDLHPYFNNRKSRQIKTGIRQLDNHLLYKGPDLLIVGGLANVGKTVGTLWLMFTWSMLLTIKPKWLIFSSENNNIETKVLLMEWFHETPVHEQTPVQRAEAIQWIDEHFLFMKNTSWLSLDELLKEATEIKKHWQFNGLLIDPYSSLKHGGYSEHYANAGRMRSFIDNQKVKLIVTMHASTEAARREIKEGIAVPLSSHLEMGVMWHNRSDSLVIMHRHVQNEELANRMEMHVCKIKSVRSGGKPTDGDKPIYMYYQDSFGGFSWQPKPIPLKI